MFVQCFCIVVCVGGIGDMCYGLVVVCVFQCFVYCFLVFVVGDVIEFVVVWQVVVVVVYCLLVEQWLGFNDVDVFEVFGDCFGYD